MSIVGRRGSNGFGWTWSGPPSGPRRSPLPPLLLALAGGGLILVVVALVLLGVWLSDRDDNSSADTNGAAAPTPAVTTMSSPTAAPTPAPGGQGPVFRLAAWDGERWRFEQRLKDATYHEGEAVPFHLRIDQASIGDAYHLTIIYDCKAFSILTDYERDHGSEPALASGGPKSAAADTTLSFRDELDANSNDGEAGSLSLWGGSFTAVDGALPSPACDGEKSLPVALAAAADTLHLMWAAEISVGAAEMDAPLRLAVRAASIDELSVEIDPDSVRPTQP